MPSRNTPTRSVRGPETQPEASDVAAIFERRLLARGIRPDDFLDWRNSSDLPAIPNITPLQFGRGVAESPILPMALATPDPAPAAIESVDEPEEPCADGEPEDD
jgi:hypothetical protein